MPKRGKVARCVKRVSKSKGKGAAIAICQASTGLSYRTGRKPKKKR